VLLRGKSGKGKMSSYDVSPDGDWACKNTIRGELIYFEIVNGKLVLRFPGIVTPEKVAEAQEAVARAQERDPLLQMHWADTRTGQI
jgi:hypothetical protein